MGTLEAGHSLNAIGVLTGLGSLGNTCLLVVLQMHETYWQNGLAGCVKRKWNLWVAGKKVKPL
jgi:hypothetical protein